jgi:hypothetical protein
MVMRDCPFCNKTRLDGKPVPGGQRGLFVFAAAFACCAALAVNLGAESSNARWAVSGQRPLTLNSQQADTTQPIMLHQVLQQMESPLLPGTPPGNVSVWTAQGSLRLAVRPDGVDGWRPAGQTASQSHKPWRVEIHAPPLNAPANRHLLPNSVAKENEPASEAVEPDCGDQTADSEVQADEHWESSDSAPTEEANPSAGDDEPGARSSASIPEDEPSSEPADDEADQAAQKKAGSRPLADVGPITDESSAKPAKKPAPPRPLTKQLMSLRARVRGVLKGYYRRQLNSREHDPWEVMHGMLAYGVHSRIRQGGPRGNPVTSVGWLCYNKPCKNLTLMYVTPKGELRAKYGVGLQGHLGQLLAMLAQCRVSEEYPIRVGKRDFTILDLIEAEKKTCYPKSELTFKLLAFQYYLDLSDTWVNDQGVQWDFPRLIREELAQPIRGAACGGTHRLSSLSLTVKARQRRGEPLDGEYARAAEFVKKYHRYAFSLQNRDGSLSTEWFRGRGDDSDIDRRIKTTGHILEWLCYSLSDEELRQPKTIAAVSYLTNLMSREYDHDWEVGPMSHATHALLIYDERVFQPFDSADYTAIYRPKRRSEAATAEHGAGRTIR